MQKSTTRIRTSHVGRLPPPKGWEDMPARLANAEVIDSGEIVKKSMTNIASECTSANIVRDHAVILPNDATQ